LLAPYGIPLFDCPFEKTDKEGHEGPEEHEEGQQQVLNCI
jgi:hypothetical protein